MLHHNWLTKAPLLLLLLFLSGLGKLPHKGAMTGSMPGTIAVLAQYVTKARRASSFCVIINTRPDNADEFVQSLTTLSHAYLETVFP
jgi:hypothetical protein